MLDIVDRVVKTHIQSMAKIKGEPIKVFSLATADADDQAFTQAGTSGKRPDKIQLPFLSLVRLPDIDITDSAQTKRVHNYAGYKLFKDKEYIITYNRATLHYGLTVFAENRKTSEDIMTALFASLRNACQLKVGIEIPIEYPGSREESEDGKPTYVKLPMEPEIVMDGKISQTLPQDLTKMQLYKCRFSFDLQNVNIYNFTRPLAGKFTVTINSRNEGDENPVGEMTVIFNDTDRTETQIKQDIKSSLE